MRSFGGEGGRSSKDHIGSQGGGGGGQDGPKKDYIIFECSLIVTGPNLSKVVIWDGFKNKSNIDKNHRKS